MNDSKTWWDKEGRGWKGNCYAIELDFNTLSITDASTEELAQVEDNKLLIISPAAKRLYNALGAYHKGDEIDLLNSTAAEVDQFYIDRIHNLLEAVKSGAIDFASDVYTKEQQAEKIEKFLMDI